MLLLYRKAMDYASLLLPLLGYWRHREIGHVDARPRRICGLGDSDRDRLASRRLHGSAWKAGPLARTEALSPGSIAETGDRPKRRIVESNRGRHRRGEPVAASRDWKGQAA